MSEKISNSILESVSSVAKSREEHYVTSNAIPSKESIESMIQSYSYKNAAIYPIGKQAG